MILLTVCCMTPTGAQQMGVEHFTRVKRYLWNRSRVTSDKQQALLDLKTEERGFTFLANGKEPAKAEEGKGIITLSLPHKTRYLTISHDTYGQRTWRVPVKYLKRKKHYRATLVASAPGGKLQRQWVVFNITPENAIIHLDSTMTLVREKSTAFYLPVGTHHYQMEAPFHETVKDSFLLTDAATLVLNIGLQPTYSYLTVRTPWTGGEIHVDGAAIGRQEATSGRLTAGIHRLSVFVEGECYYDALCDIGEAEKKVVCLTQEDRMATRAQEGHANTLTQEDRRRAETVTTEGMVNIYSNVVGADIYIDNVRVGTTPCILSHLTANQRYAVSLRKEGYKEACVIVKPKGNELTDLNIKMKRQ